MVSKLQLKWANWGKNVKQMWAFILERCHKFCFSVEVSKRSRVSIGERYRVWFILHFPRLLQRTLRRVDLQSNSSLICYICLSIVMKKCPESIIHEDVPPEVSKVHRIIGALVGHFRNKGRRIKFRGEHAILDGRIIDFAEAQALMKAHAPKPFE